MKRSHRTAYVLIITIIFLISNVFAAIDPAEKIDNTNNVAPTVNFSIAMKKDIDLVIVTDYSGAQLNNIQSKINELKIAVSSRYNVNTYLIGANETTKLPDKITIANQDNQVPILSYTRYFHMYLYKTGYEQSTTNGTTNWNNTYEDRTVGYEQVQINEGQPLPPFQKSNNYTFTNTKSNVGYQGMGWCHIYDEYDLYDPQNVAATKMSPNITTSMSTSSYVMNMTYTLSSHRLDNSWSLSSVSTQSQLNDFEAVNMDKINNLSLKDSSEKHVIFLTDNDSLKSYRTWGNYYPFGSSKASNIGSFLDSNNCNVYTVTTENALDIKVNQQNAKLSSAYTQGLSLRELLVKAKGEQQVYDKSQFTSVINHITKRYTSSSNTNKIDLKIATDYTGTKLTNLNNSLQSLKSNLSTKGIDIRYDLYTNKAQSSSIPLKNKQVSGSGDQVLLLKENGNLYYYKTSGSSKTSMVDPNMIFAQYPYSQGKIMAQGYWKYNKYTDEEYYVQVSMGNSFSTRAIPPILVATDVTDAYMIDRYIVYLKNDSLYITANYSNATATDDYRTSVVANSSNIKKLYYIQRSKMLYAVKNDGSLWAIGNNWYLYAPGTSDYNYVPVGIKNGFLSCSLEKVGQQNFNEKVIDLVGEYAFTAVLTDKGEVYGWGDNYYGQLGNGSSYAFGTSGATELIYYSPSKMSITGVTDIASTEGALYITSTLGTVYHTGLAGITYEKYNLNSSINPVYPSNLYPIPSYINKNSYYIFKSLGYDSSYNSYYTCMYYTKYPQILISGGNIITGATKFIKTQEPVLGCSIYANTSSQTIDISQYRLVVQNRLNNFVNDYWNSYSYQERQNKINDYQKSHNMYLDKTHKSKMINDDSGPYPPLGYSIVNKDGDLVDNVMGYTPGEYYHNTPAQTSTSSSLLTLYNLTNADVMAKLNEITYYPIQSIFINNISAPAARSDAEKFFLYVSDTQGAASKENITNYISLSNMPSSFTAYLNNNSYKNVIITPTVNRESADIKTLLGADTGIYLSIDNFIKTITDKYNPTAELSVEYLIVNEGEIYYNNAYNDYESDPAYKSEYYYDHDENYFENGQGKIANAGVWSSTPITKFTNKGKYTIRYRTQDNPSLLGVFSNYRKWSNESLCTVYVHDKPEAMTNIAITPNGSYYRVTATDGGSFDKDHLSRADKGIVAHEWHWKESTETTWHSEQMNISNAVMSKVYDVEHRVQDMEGAWSDWTSSTIDNAKPPVAQYTLTKNTISTTEKLQLKDTSYAYFGNITRWQWTIIKQGTNTVISNTQHTNSNTGTGAMLGYDINVKTDYSDVGPGTYRIYLRVKGSNGLWSDGGTDALTGYNLGSCYYRDIIVKEAFKLEKFRVVMVRDIQLEEFYKNPGQGIGSAFYIDKPMYVNNMAVDETSFGSNLDGLTKGYRFEFEIDSTNFNEDLDTIVITPRFYTCDIFTRDSGERELYWEDSNHKIYKAGEGGHASWKTITLTKSQRVITSSENATWRGEYLIPATAWAVPKYTSVGEAKANNLKRDIIVYFEIKGYKAGVHKFDYNAEQWTYERTLVKYPYQIGDVIKYSWDKSCIDDINIKDNR